MRSKVAYLVKPGHFEIGAEEIKPDKGQVLIRIASCGLCNYELNFWKGIMTGPAARRLGHEAAGIVVELGEGVKDIKVGDRVTGAIWHSFSEYAVANESEIFVLNESIDVSYGFIEPITCVTTVLRSTAPEAGDYGIVTGCGPMGLWAVQALKGSLLAGLIAMDVKDENLLLAKKYGATHVINSGREDAEAEILKITAGHGVDFIIEGTGNAGVPGSMMKYLRDKFGRLVLMSSYKQSAETFDLLMAVRKSIRIIAAHGSETSGDDWRRAACLLNNGTYDVKSLVTHEFSLDDINTAFRMLENKPEGYLKGMIRFY